MGFPSLFPPQVVPVAASAETIVANPAVSLPQRDEPKFGGEVGVKEGNETLLPQQFVGIRVSGRKGVREELKDFHHF